MDLNKTERVIALFDKYAHMYQERYMSVEKYEESLDLFCASLLGSGAHVLELACGPGNITKYVLSIFPTLKITATDLSEEMLKLAKQNNPGVETKILDCRAINTIEKKFDGIICGFGLPYLNKKEALQLIGDASQFLNKDGLLYLSTMEGNYKEDIRKSSVDENDILSSYFHEAEYLNQKMKEVGFQIIHESRISYIDESNSDVTDLILIGKLG